MVGKRVVFLKRPAVLCAAVFVVGIVLAEYPAWMVVGITVGLYVGGLLWLQSLRKGGRRVSASDKLLVLAPLFLLLGFFVMSREKAEYDGNLTNFASSMETGREVLATGTVSHIRLSEGGIRFELEDARAASYAGEEVYRSVGTLLVYTDDIKAENGALKDGQRVFIYGRGSEFTEASNPGAFDAKQYYFSLGITGAMQGETIRITDFSYHRLNQALFQAKKKLLESYVIYLGEEGAGVISSMLLGERVLLSEETEELYRHGGISHILAISGLHVSMIGMALYELLRKTFLGRNGAIPVSCVGVILYGTFVEAGTSTKRAVIMFLLLLLAAALGRTYDTLSAMSVSVIVILCGSPGALYTASFQLSFAAAYGASVLAVLLKEREKERTPEEKAVHAARQANSKWYRLRTYLIGKGKNMFIFGLAIQVVTFPFTAYHFFEYPTYGFLINPVVVPLMTILLLCGLLSGVCGLALPWLGYFFAGGVRGILQLYETLCEWVSRLPLSLLLIGQPAVWQMGVYFVVLAVCLFVWQGGGKSLFLEVGMAVGAKSGQKGRKILWCVLLFLPFCLLPVPSARFEAAFLDVGQGDGIVLREPGGAVLLVDGGSTSVQKVGEKRIVPYLKAQGIRMIDCALVSHTDSDHISGLKEILEEMPVYSAYRGSLAGYIGAPVIKSIALPVLTEPDEAYLALVELAKEKKVEVRYVVAGDRLEVGEELSLSCLAPRINATYSDKNAASMVLLASYGELDMLLTGDMDASGEAVLLEEGILEKVSVEVLKVGHHGSYTSSSEEFITALQPVISVISCGKDNRYGHPHKETLEMLYGVNSGVLRTDESGCVTVKVGFGRKITVEEWKTVK
ncbi:MAG: DNA internalization-related competence protein ComEC/Rec2 [Lachnospiraceae bacterium]|nr:DNA internalization-related competence protein ComEC/Rec2 [Lachnospiraceae bacterium]